MACKGECSVRNFGLSHPTPNLFVNSQWKIPQLVYLIYRIFVAAFCIVWVILSGATKYDWYIKESDRVKWFIYLTNWMFLTLTLETIFEMVIVGISIRIIKTDGDYKKMTWYLKIMWVFYNTISSICLVICVAYWVLIYPYQGCPSPEVYDSCGSPATPTCTDQNPLAATVCVERCRCPSDRPIWYDDGCITATDCPAVNSTGYSTKVYVIEYVYLPVHYLDYVIHGAPIVYVLLNVFITGIPIRIHHFWHSVIYAVVYCIFTIVYESAGGTNSRGNTYIYSVLDWSKPGTAAIYAVIVGLIVPIMFWLILYGLYWVRISIAKCCCGLSDKHSSLYGEDGGAHENMKLSEHRGHADNYSY